jgi:hypothetical protein
LPATILFRVSCFISKNITFKTYQGIILPVVFYEYETSSLSLREEYRLRVFEKEMLKGMFRTEREEDVGDWR